ncbi:MAG: S-layer homology domain-containing protein [Clostridia bacterium]|nr:S-layer homology domain-containing protein [Clostridia bacterium]
MKKLALLLSALLFAGTVSFTAFASATHPDIVIPYAKIAKGQVDRKSHSLCEIVTDSAKGEVYKVKPNPETAETGSISIDSWNLTNYKVDFNHYNTITIEYKYTSDTNVEYFPNVNISNYGGKTLKSGWKPVAATDPLVKNEWSKVKIDLSAFLKNNVGTDGILWQMHLYPFGMASVKDLTSNETILISSLTFSAEEERGEDKVKVDLTSEYTVKFLYNKEGLENPKELTVKAGDVITVPEVGAEKNGKSVTKWFCDADNSYYDGKSSYTVPAEDVTFHAFWQSTAEADDIRITYYDYSGGICNRVDTATLEKLEDYEGKKVVKVIPNPASENGGAINLDGWTYNGANVDASKYSTAILVYKYLSEKPVTGKSDMAILKWQQFSKGHYMTSREDIISGRWAAASFDMSGARENTLEGKIPVVTQMHIHPIGSANKVSSMLASDEIYVADIIFLPKATFSVSYNPSFIGGYEDGTFRPNGNMTRAEACTVIARLMAGADNLVPANTETSFSDVKADDWFAKYIAYCEKAGLLTSYSGTFLPNQNITRAEFVELVFKMGLLNDSGKNGTFTDVPADHARAEVISAAGKAGLVNGYDNGDGTFSFKPDNTITRTEVVKVINNALGRVSNAEAVKESGCAIKFSDVAESFWGWAEILSAANSHISCKGTDGKDFWVKMEKTGDEGFTPDYEAAIKKADEVDALMVKRIDEIRNTASALPETEGRRIYVSNKGNDSNDGLSESSPLATIQAAQKIAKKGDSVLLERGGEWRINFRSTAGVSYGAYGTGAKPIINGNLNGNVADEKYWSLVEGTTNIWKFRDKIKDVGNIIYDDGSIYTDKIVPAINDRLELTDKNHKVYDPKTSHTANNTFFMVYDNITSRTLNMSSAMGTLYLRCDEGNPGKVYNKIELASYGHAIVATSNNHFDNLCIMYAGCHGITAGTCENLVITNCEIGWIGGSNQYLRDGKTTRYGNGIQIYGGCNGFTIDNCYVYECYDAGISPQYSAVGTNEIILRKIYYTNNVIDKCIYNIEYFMGAVESGDAERYIETMHYTGNILARSGYGWGMDPSRSACIKGWDHYNKASDFIIKDNIILNPAYNAYHIGADFAGWLPDLSGNTYIVREKAAFMKYGAPASAQYYVNSMAEQTLDNVLEETNYTIYYLPADYKK